MNEKYDLICVFNPNTAEEKIDAALGRIEKKITLSGGSVENISKPGLRKLAVRMRKFKPIKDGFFVQVNFTSPTNVPQEISATVRVNEDIMRFVLTRAIEEKIEPVEEKSAEETVEVNPEMLIGKPE
jgi:ribosomal protein S6